MTLTYTDDTYTETVDGWTIVAYSWSPGVVTVTSPGGTQEVSIDKDGDLTFEVTEGERGRGYSGDCAADRLAPVKVLAAAIRVWAASRS